MKTAAALIVALCLALCACDRPGAGQATSDEKAARDPGSDPGRIARARPVRGLGSVCRLETINGRSSRRPPDLKAGAPAVFMGWAMVADGREPVPASIHLVLRRAAPQGERDIYLELGHMPRPDVAGGDASRQMAGFEGLATLPDPGKYELLIAQGDKDWQALCSTGVSIEIAPVI